VILTFHKFYLLLGGNYWHCAVGNYWHCAGINENFCKFVWDNVSVHFILLYQYRYRYWLLLNVYTGKKSLNLAKKYEYCFPYSDRQYAWKIAASCKTIVKSCTWNVTFIATQLLICYLFYLILFYGLSRTCANHFVS
jgi:hypothetical protein